jgi:hypothetical protein
MGTVLFLKIAGFIIIAIAIMTVLYGLVGEGIGGASVIEIGEGFGVLFGGLVFYAGADALEKLIEIEQHLRTR